jgi:hypothetical protein
LCFLQIEVVFPLGRKLGTVIFVKEVPAETIDPQFHDAIRNRRFAEFAGGK